VTEAASGRDGWTPGVQRPPFVGENEAALVHGARSERKVGPLAARIVEELLEDPDTPAHIREPIFAPSVQAWARAEAQCKLLFAWLADKDIMTGLTALASTTEEETRERGRSNRKSVTKTIPSVIDQLRRAEILASNLRSKLGLDPVSAARVGRDLALARHLSAGATPLDDALAEIEWRRALTAGGDG
jgi:hypothetical protein